MACVFGLECGSIIINVTVEICNTVSVNCIAIIVSKRVHTDLVVIVVWHIAQSIIEIITITVIVADDYPEQLTK